MSAIGSDQSFQTIFAGRPSAMAARQHIHVDGTVTVELVRFTHNPRINKIILDTLRTWMHYPAISKGIPVESVQEIKIDVSDGD